MFWTTIVFLITLSILIAIHEFGHFLAARLCGVYVDRFSIGFGKKLLSYHSKKGTEFTLAMIPLGGYVKMRDSRAQELTADEISSSFDHQTIFKRATIISAGPIANFILAILIYWAIFQIGIMYYPVKVENILPNTPASTVNFPKNMELKSIDDIKIETWSDVNMALIGAMGDQTVKIAYTSDSENSHTTLVNIAYWHVDLEKTSPIAAFGFVPKKIEILPIISKLVDGAAAQKAGLKPGDEIITYDGIDYDNWDNFVARVKTGKMVKLNIKRDQQTVTINLEPTIIMNNDGREEGVAGFYPTANAQLKQYDIISAFVKGVKQTGLTAKLIARSFYQLVTGIIGLKNLSGPVSIAQSAGLSASYGLVPYLYFLAFISISLGIMNLIPLPILDGGHLAFLLIEKIKGAPLTAGTQEYLYRLGFILLMVIMGVALFNDFGRILE